MLDNIIFDYHYEEEAERYAFFRIPKALFTEPVFKKLSDGAKILYGQLLDVMSLSRKNGWIDEKGRVYIKYSIKKVKEVMNCSNDKAVKMLRELDSNNGVGLIEKLKKGQGEATTIYVKSFIIKKNTNRNNDIVSLSLKTHSEIQNSKISKDGIQEFEKTEYRNSEKQNSIVLESGIQDFREIECNNINLSDTKSIKSFNQSSNKEIKDEVTVDGIKEVIKHNIDYNTLILQHSIDDIERINELIEIIVDIVSIKRRVVIVDGIEYPYGRVREMFLRLNMCHIEYVLDSLNRYNKELSNSIAFLTTALYNAPKTINNYYHAKVNHDMSTT